MVKFLLQQVDKLAFFGGQIFDELGILWCQDILQLGEPIEFEETLSRIGAIAMDGKTACMEQEGKVCNKLPVATDSRFIMTEQREEAENE